ncbi:MAG: 50S ribosomal protein L13 [Actinomycetota bacterium]
MKTHSTKASEIKREWFIVDADDKILGRLAAEVAHILRGKHKPMFTPHLDTGDHVVVVNAAKVRLSGNKAENKVYYRHSGYPGGIRELKYSKLIETRPEQVVEQAIKGMLPHNRLGRSLSSKLKVYAGSDHPHAAQQPKPLELKNG